MKYPEASIFDISLTTNFAQTITDNRVVVVVVVVVIVVLILLFYRDPCIDIISFYVRKSC